MRVLSLYQPWAWFVVHGFKRWETRSWSAGTGFGPLLIHAGKTVCPVGREVYYSVRAEFGDAIFEPNHPPPFDELPRGCLVGVVDFVCSTDMVPVTTSLERMLGDFSEGRYFFGFRDPQFFSEPIPARGFQRFWNYTGPLPAHLMKEKAYER